MTPASTAEQTARRAASSPWIDRLARLGFCARGLVYIVVGFIALQIADGGEGSSGDEASKDGALREIVEHSYGRPLLVVLAVGLGGYAVWRASEAAFGKRDEDDERKRTAKRAGSAAKAVLYGAFLLSTLQLIADPTSERRGAGEQETTVTARILEVSGGRLLVGAVGLATMVGSGYVAYRGLAQKFNKRLDTSDMGRMEGRVIDVLGTVGMAARGLVFGVAGFLLLKAAIDFDPEQAKGLDGTLKVMAQQTYGQLLLTATSVGIIAYGLYSFAEARYRQL